MPAKAKAPPRKKAPRLACSVCGKAGKHVQVRVHGPGFKEYVVLNELCLPCRDERQARIDKLAEGATSLR